ncbi:cbb3-type cytochrome c oxidase subunit 3 [Oceaniglobus ichthyenteri]|uniref:cbb3-type cytochrome c oxidase subunit 3 n=1 Tax=Oceaniglobus ichthyenteri TaxID=2136177 RepID=UPI000D367F29|nr:cbb3-type cytochrome c oxidase subunit 3 [Oceaniglobus ichthyenteri]
METYTFLRYVADSWFLLAMTLFFLGVIAWAFRPGSRKTHDDISQIPLREELETIKKGGKK